MHNSSLSPPRPGPVPRLGGDFLQPCRPSHRGPKRIPRGTSSGHRAGACRWTVSQGWDALPAEVCCSAGPCTFHPVHPTLATCGQLLPAPCGRCLPFRNTRVNPKRIGRKEEKGMGLVVARMARAFVSGHGRRKAVPPVTCFSGTPFAVPRPGKGSAISSAYISWQEMYAHESN